MTTSEIEIPYESIRAFAAHTLKGEAVDHFLDTACYHLEMRNMPALVMQDAIRPILEVGLVVGVQESTEKEKCVHMTAWVPFDQAQKIMGQIADLHEKHGLEKPHQLMDFQNMDASICGKDYIRAMLICCAEAGQDIT